ncbi:hypothetical protein [Streptomyces sp. NPDC003327]
MQRPNAAQLTCGSGTVALATVALLLLSGATTTLGIAAICVAGLLLGVLVAVTMPARAHSVKTSAPVASSASGSGSACESASASGNDEIRVPGPRVGARAGSRTGS